MNTMKQFCILVIVLLTSSVLIQNISYAAGADEIIGYWKSTKTLPPMAEHQYFHITENSFKSGKRPVEKIKITIKNEDLLIISDRIPMPLEVIKPIDKSTFHSIRGVPVEFKRLTKEEYEKGILEQNEAAKRRLNKKVTPKNDPF